MRPVYSPLLTGLPASQGQAAPSGLMEVYRPAVVNNVEPAAAHAAYLGAQRKCAAGPRWSFPPPNRR